MDKGVLTILGPVNYLHDSYECMILYLKENYTKKKNQQSLKQNTENEKIKYKDMV